MRNRAECNNLHNRRSFLAAASGTAVFTGWAVEDAVAQGMQNVNRHSSPSELKITDLRVATIHGAPMRCPVIRIDTNQGITGWGEVRDGGSEKYALMLKSRILGENPCNVEKLFKRLKQFGNHGRLGGGVSGVEMALWDLAGKAYGVPVYQMLGGRYRDTVRLYCDTDVSRDHAVYARRMKERVDQGFTFLKMDVGINLLRDIPGAVIRPGNLENYNQTMHPFTGVQVTQKGIELMCEYVEAVREAVGYEIPLCADHFGHIGVNCCIRLGKALEQYHLAWLEDMVPWQFGEQMKQIRDAVDTPILTGEDIYLKEEFIKLIDMGAVDIVHPDLASAGGILETKKIGDYAEEKGVAMAMHFAGTPISFMANVHCAAATQNFLALEHHSVDVDWWEDLVIGDKPLADRGFANVPSNPGLGVELNEAVAREHTRGGYFEPTDDWNEARSWDRTWS